jgi:hypothetical protein
VIVGKGQGNSKAGKGAGSTAWSPALCAITTVTARDAGEALMTVARKLGNAGILTPAGARILEQEGRRIKSEQDRHDWSILIDPTERVKFEWTKDKNDNDVQPWICADVSVDQRLLGRPPFRSLDVAVQFDDLENKPVARWHVDLANPQGDTFQSGPLVHLQYGGHQEGFRELDHPLKAPRWCHPPMEAALVCEVIAANFYENDWLTLREDESWCRAIARFQQLCYPNYFNKMAEALLKPRTTLLNEVWAGDWVRNVAASAA